MAHVVTCFLRTRARVLLTRRSDAVGTYRGRWAGVSGYVEGDPADALDDARREIREETGRTDASLVRAGDPLEVVDGEREWTVHPFLFDVPSREVSPNEELAATEWVHPPAMLERETVPGLWAAYERVAPTVETVRDDSEHGSAYVSLRALEALRDRAAVADDRDAAAAAARDLRDARPSMAAVANRINRAMAAADEDGRTPDAVREATERVIDDALDADEAAAEVAARVVAESTGDEGSVAPDDDRDAPTVATLSRSGTVLAALERTRPAPAVVVGESRPAREGVGVAERLADAGHEVTLTTDAALPALLAVRSVDGTVAARDDDGTTVTDQGIDAALVGADAVLADGSVVNKAGTRALALAAAREGVPLYVVAARDKVRPDETMHAGSGDPADLYDGPRDVRVANPLFDRTPADLVTGLVTEDGVLDVEGVRAVAAEHREHAAWDDVASG